MRAFIEALLRTNPFVTCELGNGYRVVMLFGKPEHAQELHELLIRAVTDHRKMPSSGDVKPDGGS